ncbi:hypothetical protein QG37_03994 [Candidozyma auris]|nr:hypothetical protein QG37_03994 [[Candida] auris]
MFVFGSEHSGRPFSEADLDHFESTGFLKFCTSGEPNDVSEEPNSSNALLEEVTTESLELHSFNTTFSGVVIIGFLAGFGGPPPKKLAISG